MSTKITKTLLEYYNITAEEVYQQASENLKSDGYIFCDMKNVLESLCMDQDYKASDKLEEGQMYILTNASKIYGAAGILYKALLKAQVGNKNCYILPSSVHETIFIPAGEEMKQTELDIMVREINESQVDQEERLSNHSYYYDAGKDEIRIAA